MEEYFRFEPDGEATRVVFLSDFETPGKLPGVVRGFVVKGFSERYARNVLADLKALAEAKVLAHA